MNLKFKVIINFLLLTGLFIFLDNCNIEQINIPQGLTTSPVSVNLGGVVNGLDINETVTLQNNGADIQMIIGTGTGVDSFTFPTKLSTGEVYYVTVLTQPLTKICVVGGNVGTVSSTDVLTLLVSCTPLNTPTFVVGGTASNLLGSGLVLRMNGTENLAVNGSGPFAFSTTLLDGATYDVVIATQPSSPSQTCIVTSGSGVINSADVSTIAVNCVTNQYSVGVTVSGLNPGDSVTLQNNGSDNITITEPVVTGAFSLQEDGMAYLVSVFTQPPGGFCWVNFASGNLNGSSPNIPVVCSYGGATFTVGVTVSGLNGGTLVLKNSANNENLAITANGFIVFTTTFPDLAAYNVSVQTNPTSPDQSCVVTGGDNSLGGGNIAGANVTSILVNCSTNSYSVGGSIAFAGSGSVTLLNNGSDPILITSPATSFSFPASIASGSAYNVTISSTGGGISCTVSNGIGVVGSSNVTGVSVNCGAPTTYTIGGNISGLPVPIGSSSGVTLQNNGGNNIVLTSNGGFSFSTPLLNGNSYNVTVLSQPTNPGEICTVLNPSGTVSGAAVTSVVVTCSINTYTVSGTVSGLATGEQVIVQNNSAGDQTVNYPATNFTFPPQNDGTSYSVTVLSSSPSKICTPGASTGTINAGSISTVTVTCNAAPLYAVNVTVSGWPVVGSTALTLKNNASDYLSINMDGVYSFSTVLANGASYSVSIVQQPTSPNRTCNFTSGFSGTIPGAPVNITLNCPINQYSIGGSVSGLSSGETVVLQNNGGDNRSVTGTGSPFRVFTFATLINDLASYNVTVLSNPSGKTCTAGANTGTVNGGPVSSVAIDCGVTPTYTVGGAMTGLAGGSVILQNNLGDNLTVNTNGVFTFATALNNSDPYSVTVFSQPTGPNQLCTVTSGGSGNITAANVTSVNINCVTLQYTAGGMISGMNGGDSITLLNNGITPVTRNANGAFTFPPQNDGTPYSVTIQTMPATTTCTVGAGNGTLSGSNINSVTVNCSAAGTYSIGGSLSGLTGTSVTLSVNGGVSTTILNVDGSYSFPATFSNGFIYSVGVTVNPTGPNQTCTVTNPNGTIAGVNIGNVNISCATNTYTISGFVAGLATSSPGPLENLPIIFNGATAVIPTGDAPNFTSAPINDGSMNVPLEIANGPTSKDCNFDSTGNNNRTVNIAGANVTGINVTCSLLTVGVQAVVTGLTANGLNGLNIVNYISGNGSYTSSIPGINGDGTYPFAFQAPSTNYDVVVTLQPLNGLCTVTGGSNTMGTVTVNVSISCVPTGGGIPATLSLGTPTNGIVVSAKSDLFQITGLGAGTIYTVSVTGLTNDVNLYVYNDSGFTTLVCSSTNSGLTGESCSVSGSTAYYMNVLNVSTGSANYTITVNPPPSSEGTSGSPILLTLDISRSGTVGALGSSYYQITGLAAGQLYPFILDSMSNNVNLYVYSNAAFTTLACFSGNAGLVDDTCQTSGFSSYYIKVVDLSGSGANFSLLASSPVPPTTVSLSVPYAGNVPGGQAKYYQISGLTASSKYMVDLNAITNNVNLFVYSDSIFATQVCSSVRPANDTESCLATGFTAYYIKVADVSGSGANYNVLVYPQPASEGSTATPIVLTLGVPYSGKVGPSGNSYYQITGLGTGPYQFTVTDLDNNADLELYDSNAFNAPALINSSLSSGLVSEYLSWSGLTAYYFKVIDMGTIGSSYKITVSVVVPTVLSLSTPYPGVLNGTSDAYFEITGLASGTSYTFSMTGLTVDYDLYVYTDPNFSTAGCSSFNTGIVDESCSRNGSTAYYIWIYNYAGTGGSFTLNVY